MYFFGKCSSSMMRESIEAPITVSEIEKNINNLSIGKSPGPDGFGASFYNRFKEELARILHYVITEAYDKPVLPPSFHRSFTVLIAKSSDPEKLLSVYTEYK